MQALVIRKVAEEMSKGWGPSWMDCVSTATLSPFSIYISDLCIRIIFQEDYANNALSQNTAILKKGSSYGLNSRTCKSLLSIGDVLSLCRVKKAGTCTDSPLQLDTWTLCPSAGLILPHNWTSWCDVNVSFCLESSLEFHSLHSVPGDNVRLDYALHLLCSSPSSLDLQFFGSPLNSLTVSVQQWSPHNPDSGHNLSSNASLILRYRWMAHRQECVLQYWCSCSALNKSCCAHNSSLSFSFLF